MESPSSKNLTLASLHLWTFLCYTLNLIHTWCQKTDSLAWQNLNSDEKKLTTKLSKMGWGREILWSTKFSDIAVLVSKFWKIWLQLSLSQKHEEVIKIWGYLLIFFPHSFGQCHYYPLPMHSICEDTIVIPSTCIRGRDMVITLLVRVCVCLSVCVSPVNS